MTDPKGSPKADPRYAATGREGADAVQRYEQELQDALEVDEVVAVSSGTAALHTALAALGIGPGDEVLVPALAVPMSAAPIVHLGARPVVVDLSRDGLGLDLDDLAAKTGPATAAIVPVLMWGRADPALGHAVSHARTHDLAVVVDAAQAIGTTVPDDPPRTGAAATARGARQAGLDGDITCFSTQRQKILTTGEGGFLTTRHPELAERARRYRSHGVLTGAPSPTPRANGLSPGGAARDPRPLVGHNFRLAESLAQVGRRQLCDLPELVAGRRAQHDTLMTMLAGHPALRPISPSDPGWNGYAALFRLELSRPREFCRHLARLGVPNSTGSFGLIPLDERPELHTPSPLGRARATRAADFLDHVLAMTLNHHDTAILSRYAETIIREIDIWADCSRT